MTSSDVYTQLLAIVTPKSSEETEKALSLCENALDWVIKRKKDTVDDDDSRIAYLAAGIAYYSFALSRMTDTEDPRSFKAGDVTVKKNILEDLTVAEKLKQARLAESIDILADTQFGAWSV